MVANRNKTISVSLFVVTVCLLFISGPAFCATRGITVKARISYGSTEKIMLYDLSHALVIGIDKYQQGWPRLSSATRDAKLVADAKIVARDAHYEKYASGIVKDTKTGLEWYAGPDKHTKWAKAKSWVASLNVGGGGWRMPTREELSTLYQKGAGKRNMTPLLKTEGWFIWSGERRDSSYVWFFHFGDGLNGGRVNYQDPLSHFQRRGFAVRSRR